MASLPTVGGSEDTWGTELNAFLGVSLDASGFVKRQLAEADIANVPTGVDITDLCIYGSGYAQTLKKIGILVKGTPAGIDNSNTVVLTIKNGAAQTILTKTYNTGTQPPTNDFEDLGTISIATVAANDKLTLTMVQGTTANMPGFSIILE